MATDMPARTGARTRSNVQTFGMNDRMLEMAAVWRSWTPRRKGHTVKYHFATHASLLEAVISTVTR